MYTALRNENIIEVYNKYYKPPTYLTKSVTVKSYAYQKLPFFL